MIALLIDVTSCIDIGLKGWMDGSRGGGFLWPKFYFDCDSSEVENDLSFDNKNKVDPNATSGAHPFHLVEET